MSCAQSSRSLDRFSPVEAAHRARALAEALAKGDIEAFARWTLGLELQPFHLRWLEFQSTNRRSVLLAPRGHGKTTVGDILYVIWRLLHEPDTRVLVVSNTLNQARAFLREISGHLERDEVRRSWGDVRGPRWTDTEIELRRKRIAKEPSVTATGAGGAIISRHYDLIICDDILDEENSFSANQREKTRTWFFKTLMPCLEPEGEMHIIGTRWHYADLYGELTAAGWPSLVERAISARNEALWPSKFSKSVLADLRKQAGDRIFNCQYQNDPSGYEGAIFKHKHFRFYEDGGEPGDLKLFSAADLAISSSETADYFAYVTVGLDSRGDIWVLDCERARLSFHEQVEFVLSRAAWRKPLRIAIEAVAYQKALAQELARRAPLPVVEVRDTRDKVTRAWKLAAHFETGRILLPRSAGELAEELAQFPHGPHDDQVDALFYAVETAAEYGSLRVRNF
ncbi:MAG: phage terminase large subunit [Planctomycetota bacterium]